MKRPHIWRKAGIAAIAISALALTACSGGNDNGGDNNGGGDIGDGVLRIGTTTEVVNWTPLNHVSITDGYVTSQMWPALSTWNADGTTSPFAAESVEASEDGSQVIIKLDPDFKWSDGEPITAEDVQFTFDRMRDDHLISATSFIGNYESTTIQDETTATLNMKAPSYGWAIDVEQSAALIPKHIFESVPNIAEFSIENEPDTWVGGGPFVLDNIAAGQRYDLVPNEYFPADMRADGNEEVKGVEFNIYGDLNTMQLALRNNDIDLMAPPVPSSAISELENQSNIEVVEAEQAMNYTKLSFNASGDGPMSNQRVRQAISGLVDTDAIITSVMQGHAQKGVSPVLPALTDYQPDVESYDFTADEVKDILEEEGYPNPTLVLTCDQGNANHAKSAQLVRDMLEPAGITVDIKCAERATSLTAAKAGEFDLYIHKLNQNYSAGTNLFTQFDPSNPSGLNYNLVEDAESTEMFAAVQSATTQDDYVEAVKAVAEHIHDEAYMLPLYVETLNSGFNTSRFTGYVPTCMETSTMVGPYSLAQVVPSN